MHRGVKARVGGAGVERQWPVAGFIQQEKALADLSDLDHHVKNIYKVKEKAGGDFRKGR